MDYRSGYGYGIYLSGSSNNTLSGNNASSNSGYGDYSGYGYGIYLSGSSNNTLSSNNASSNTGSIGDYSGYGYGIYLDSSSNNTLSGNNVNSNSGYYSYGIYLSGSSNNTIDNNIFNNTNNFYLYASNNNTWNINKLTITNIVGGSYIGGNFWAQPDGNGYSQKCIDSGSDGICDSPYELDSNNIDYLPLASYTAIPGPIPPVPESSALILTLTGIFGILLVSRKYQRT
jgi:parallel beta-helix repeat protein